MTKNNYLMGQEYMLRLENELLIERIAKIEKELGLKEKENKDLRIQDRKSTRLNSSHLA